MLLPEVHEELQSNEIKSIVLCGIETQACILVDENLCFFFWIFYGVLISM